jgi:transposase
MPLWSGVCEVVPTLQIQSVSPLRLNVRSRSDRPHRAAEKYKWRHLIENFFQKLKEFKRIAMRACKTDTIFAAMIYMAA